MHDGDGVCEPFEKTTSVMDCGPYTPDGYVDLWATKAYASHQDEKSCPASLVTGEPVAKVRLGINNKKGFSSNIHIVKLENSLPVQECSKEIKNKSVQLWTTVFPCREPADDWDISYIPLSAASRARNCSAWRSHPNREHLLCTMQFDKQRPPLSHQLDVQLGAYE